jgi:FkbM family methyltransferase
MDMISKIITTFFRRFNVWRLNPSRNLRKILRGSQNLSIVQIGSNDGKSGDPIHDLLNENQTWKALLVEPIPFLFERLKHNYQNRAGVRFANVAIGESTGVTTFYFLEADLKETLPHLPNYFDQLGSFNPDHIVNHLGEAIRPWIKAVEIPTLSLPELLEQHSISQFDILHIDTEGYDWKILKQLDLNRFRPRIILFEHSHLTELEKQGALKHLGNDYWVKDLHVGGDYLCTRKS